MSLRKKEVETMLKLNLIRDVSENEGKKRQARAQLKVLSSSKIEKLNR